MTSTQLFLGDCRDVMADMAADSIDSIITDPPYGLSEGPTKYLGDNAKGGGFMGKGWDKGVPGAEFWQAALRVAKPGAFLLAFGGTRTFHRLACAIEDAGWEVRDVISWVYGQGWPKSHDISKAIGKRAGAERETVRSKFKGEMMTALGVERPWKDKAMQVGYHEHAGPVPVTEQAAQWNGYGTCLKPAWEPIIVAMKPTVGTFADNALAYGVAGLWIDGGRVGSEVMSKTASNGVVKSANVAMAGPNYGRVAAGEAIGRWPANFVLTHDPRCNGTCHPECPVKLLDEQSGISTSTAGIRQRKGGFWKNAGDGGLAASYGDTGGASRFFYCSKASVAEREAGLADLALADRPGVLKMRVDGSLDGKPTAPRKNDHPTVKPLGLCRWLCRLTKTPTGGNVLDPFMGSGSTGCAAVLEGRDFIGIEQDLHYLGIAGARIEHWQKQAETEHGNG